MIQPQYLSYGYDTFHYCPNTSPIDKSQYTTAPELLLLIRYSTLCSSTSLNDKSQSITAPVPVLLILYSSLLPQYVLLIWHSTLLPKYQSYWYTTVHYCPSTNPIDFLQSTAAPILSYWYNTVHYCPSASCAVTLQSTTAPVPVLLIWHSPLLSQYQSFWYDATIAPVSILLIAYSLLLSQYLSCWYPTVHYCLSTSSTDTL